MNIQGMAQFTEQRRKQAEAFGRQHLTGLVTLVFTDMVDSTSLKEHLGDQSSFELFSKHHDIIRDCLAGFPNSQEVETAGDSFFLIFAVPSDAAAFALRVQSRLRRLMQSAGSPLQDRVRIGINLGEVIIRPGTKGPGTHDLFGVQVDTCARVMSLAKGGQILMTRPVFDNARQALKGELSEGLAPLSWVSHGYYSLKGVEEPFEICEVAEMGHGMLTPPTSSEKARRYESVESEPVLGWRPALGQMVPNTQWVLEKQLGHGAFGEAWLARHQRLKDQRVFKFCFRADRVRSLKREVTLFRLLKERVGGHPNIVGVQDVYFDEPPYYVMMDYSAGKDLGKWCQEHGGAVAVPLETRLEIVAQVAEGLQAAHDAGIIHRDVKPGNILVEDEGAEESIHAQPTTQGHDDEPGRPRQSPLPAEASAPGGGVQPTRSRSGKVRARLTDFGIGQVESEALLAGLTRSGFTQTMLAGGSSSQTGTQMYMAPEIIAGMAATTRSDIYSLGVVLFQLLVGDLNRPLTADWASAVPDDLLREDLAHCFAWNPDARFAGPVQLARHLRELPARRAEITRRQAELQAKERAAYRRGLVKAAALALLIVAGFGLLALYAFREAGRAAQAASRAAQAANLAAQAKVETQHTLSRSDYLQAVNDIDKGEVAAGLAYLARALKNDPSNSLAATRLHQVLLDYPVLLPAAEFGTRPGRVLSATFSPDAAKVAASTMEQARASIRIWNARTGAPLFPAIQCEAPLSRLQFSSDGRHLLGISLQKAQVFDAETGQPTCAVQHPNSTVRAARFSPSGQRLLTQGYNMTLGYNTVCLWKVDAGELLLTFTGHDSPVAAACFRPDGRMVATGDQRGTVIIWDAESGAPRRGEIKHQYGITDLDFSPDGRLIVTGSNDSTARVWDAATGRPITPLLRHDSFVAAVRFSPDSQTVATVSGDQMVRLWDARTGNAISQSISVPGIITAQFSPDGRVLATASSGQSTDVGRFMYSPYAPFGTALPGGLANGTVQLRDPRSGRPLGPPLQHDGPVFALDFGKDWQELLTACGNSVLLWKPETGKAVYPPLTTPRPGPHAIRISRDGRRIVAAGFTPTNSWAGAWDPQTGQPIGRVTEITLSPGQFVPNATLSVDGNRLLISRRLVTGGADGVGGLLRILVPGRERVDRFQLLDRSSGIALWTYEASAADANNALTLSDDARHALVIHQSLNTPTGSWAKVLDGQTGAAVAELKPLSGLDLTGAFSPDGRRVVTVSESGRNTFRVWDPETGQPTTPPVVWQSYIRFSEFSSAADDLLVAGGNTFQVFAAANGAPISERVAHPSVIRTASFSPDGKRIATTAEDRNLRLWDAHFGQLIGEPLYHKQGLAKSEWLSNGELLVVDTGDAVRLLNGKSGAPITDFIPYRPAGRQPGLYYPPAVFSPDGRFFVDVAGGIHTIPLPAKGEQPAWLASVAECAGGLRLGQQDVLAPVPLPERRRAREEVLRLPAGAPWQEWARWVVAEPHARPVAPGYSMTVREYLAQLDTEAPTPGFLEAMQAIFPLHPLILRRPVHPVEATWLDKWQNPRVQLLTDLGFKSSWSPDGERVVFGNPQGKGLVILDLRTGQRTDLTSNGKDAAWAPAGEKIAYVAEVRYNYFSQEEVWLTDSQGRSPLKLMNGTFPSWLGDGKTVVCYSHENKGLIAVDTTRLGAQPHLFYAAVPANYCTIRPDGSLIACGAVSADPQDPSKQICKLVVLERATRQTIAEVPVAMRGVLPAFSPDGRFVAYGGFDADQAGVSVYDLKTKKSHLVAKGLYSLPAWSPDGKKLSFDYRPTTAARQIWVVTTDGLKPDE